MIVVDWGTSSLRAWRLDGAGQPCEQRSAAKGLMACDGRFEDTLLELVDGWPPGGSMLLCGMVGSRQGWVEAPYVACPADITTLAQALVRVEAASAACGRVWVVPGVSDRFGTVDADVMRGEETQIIGLLATRALSDATVCLPGTHTKWVSVRDGAIRSLQTAMTGEFYGLAMKHSILGRLSDKREMDSAAFVEGLQRAERPGGLLPQLFSARAQVLAGVRAPDTVAAYLSGLMIGHEVRDFRDAEGTVHLVGEASLGRLYGKALAHFGVDFELHPADLAAHGLAQIAALAGLGER